MQDGHTSEFDAPMRRFSWLLVNRKVISKRLSVGIVELLAEALGVAAFMMWMGTEITKNEPPSQYQESAVFQIFVFTFGAMFFFTTTGYAFTTLIVRCFWNGKRVWSYPIIAAVLFSAHFELLSHSVGGAFDSNYRTIFFAFGVGMTFFCTIFGNQFLKKHNALSLARIQI